MKPIVNYYILFAFICFNLFLHTIAAQELEIEGTVKIVDGTQGASKVLTSDADGNAQWQDVPNQLPASPNAGDMLYWDGAEWKTIPAGTQGQTLNFCDNKPTWGPCPVLATGTHYIQQSWSQETNYDRSVHLDVPAGNGPFPLVILLHGNGGNGTGAMNAFNYLTNNSDVIRVAPDGYLTSWNVEKENSKAPDAELISEILAYVKSFSNVDTTRISIIGSSNGSAMVNRLLIELPANSFNNAVCIVSPKTELAYNNNNFYYDPTGGNNYNTVIVPANDRKILAVSGTADPLIPYNGGVGVLGYVFLPAQNSAFIWAQLNGYMGAQIPDASGVPHPNNSDLIEYNYLSGDVIHYKLIDGNHGTTGGNADVQDVIVDFLGL